MSVTNILCWAVEKKNRLAFLRRRTLSTYQRKRFISPSLIPLIINRFLCRQSQLASRVKLIWSALLLINNDFLNMIDAVFAEDYSSHLIHDMTRGNDTIFFTLDCIQKRSFNCFQFFSLFWPQSAPHRRATGSSQTSNMLHQSGNLSSDQFNSRGV